MNKVLINAVSFMLRRYPLILLLGFVHSLAAYANERQTIRWLVFDFAPYYIMSDTHQGEGRDEQTIALLQQQLPNYRFDYVHIPGSRAIHELSNPQNTYCILSLYKTQRRLDKLLFTNNASTVGLSPALVMRKELANTLGLVEGEPVSLSQLLAEQGLRLGLPMNRSYGKELDHIINHSPRGSLVTRPGKDVLASLTYMLIKERLDMLVGYPSEHYYLASKMGVKEQMAIFPIAEVAPISHGYVGCSNTALGSEHIDIIDSALEKIATTDSYQQVMMRWLPPQLKPRLQQQLQTRLKAQ
ncbi:hypothetical protein CWC05_01430 [Pseudoalteromonas ruthenica]|uniref:Solute-binding protein family 3/N-terminal domain-containing protein n=1 Tax=Pseudoalteromonas ruthenica TaxID=151081 RepID=A0A5S3Z8C9_9GAMM|nr:TIGR02285 family protein [Pseudoalteromonas ruthenica]TMP88130.1 hypothetical protein CWC05_01430 [Pseudoalteromonas ruthenica]